MKRAATPPGKNRIQNEYKDTNKGIKIATMKDKRQWLEELVRQAQNAAEVNNMTNN